MRLVLSSSVSNTTMSSPLALLRLTPLSTDAASPPPLSHCSSVSSSSSATGPASSSSDCSISPLNSAGMEHELSSDSSAGSNGDHTASWRQALTKRISRPYRLFPTRVTAKRRLSDTGLALPTKRRHMRSTSPTAGFFSAADMQRGKTRASSQLRKPALTLPLTVANVHQKDCLEDSLPELRLLSATRTAPVGWSQLASAERWKGLLGEFDERTQVPSPTHAPESQRYLAVPQDVVQSVRLSPTLAQQATATARPALMSPKSTLEAVIRLTAAQHPRKSASSPPSNDYFSDWENRAALSI